MKVSNPWDEFIGEKMKEKEWNEWFTWHKDWNKRYEQAIREVKSMYSDRGERQAALKDLQKKYLEEMWTNRERILGY